MSKGIDVHGVVRAEDDRTHVPGGVTVHVADIRDTLRMSEVLSDVEPTAVFHLAGISSVGLSWEQPLLAGHVTGLAVAGLLEAVWAQQTRRGCQFAGCRPQVPKSLANRQRLRKLKRPRWRRSTLMGRPRHTGIY
ncbi:GDP-mannose 4,6-dehydratase [Ornithinimicrobium sp. INDO-MA30-4]|nr:GDP-mannose 4,6-dehydratase [Ornithinimicrobium sp. INDO-MA30-4]